MKKEKTEAESTHKALLKDMKKKESALSKAGAHARSLFSST
jgi:hypothetical protein